MPTFSYKARDKSGKQVTGTSEASSQAALAENLKKLGYAVISISEKSVKGASAISLFDKFTGVTNSEVAMLTRQLSTLIEVGVPILSALESINEQTGNSILKEAVSQISVDIKSGVSLAEAMSRHPKCFNQTYVGMVRAAEASGTLSQALQRLALLLEYEEQTRNKIKAATRYPITVTVALVLAFLVLTMFVLPRFSVIYSKFNVALPLVTRVLLGISFILSHYWYLALFVFIVLAVSINRYINTKQGRFQCDALKLKLPVFGPLFMKIALSRFARVSGIMLKTGVPVLKVLDHVAGISGNVVVARSITKVREGVNVGRDMASTMKQEKIFPAVAVQMVSLGEETGKLDDLLTKTADFFDSQIDLTIQNLTSLLEPVLVVVLGFGVLIMALAVFLPMWNLVYIFKK